ncbi:Bcl-2 ous antagonist/killer [Fasciola hepatica]|uniref:Bcl-2 ous antagonist/killer n=1 Tax=Fasciola hepatica TaxID=6192 RepID=A0A2H1CVA3_FASHE|nr:Bcl-2 ous antagonist/killer [Fasciola hepatica]
MSVDNTGDTSPQKNILNGSMCTDGDSFHSYESDDSSPTKLLMSPGNSSDTSASGTPRVIRRVGPITAIYAPDKDALEASAERMSSPTPPTRFPNEREIVVRSPTNGNRITDMETTFSAEFYTPKQTSNTKESDSSDHELPPESDGSISDHANSTIQETVLTDYANLNEQNHSPNTTVGVKPDLLGVNLEKSAEIEDPEQPDTCADIVIQSDPHGDGTQIRTSPTIDPVFIAGVAGSIPVKQSDEPAGVLELSSEWDEEASNMMAPSTDKALSQNSSNPLEADPEQSAFRSVNRRTEAPVEVSESTKQDSNEISQVNEVTAVSSPEFAVISTPDSVPVVTQTPACTFGTVPLFIGAQQMNEDEGNGNTVLLADPLPPSRSISVGKNTQTASDSDLHCANSPNQSQAAEQIQVVPAVTSHALPPDLVSIAHRMNTEPDTELQTVLDLTERTSSPAVLVKSDPVARASFSRYSPAQLVAVTGGASPEIVRNIETGTNEDEQTNGVCNSGADIIPSSTSVRSQSVFSRRRMSAPPDDDSLTPINISAIDLQVKVDTKLDPSTPEEVDESSELIFGNFIAERYKLEVSASATASVHGARFSSANASISMDIPVPSTSRGAGSNEQRFSEDDVFGTDLASIPRSNPDSMEMAVARNLAQIGDEINRRYGPRLDRMIKLLPVNECPMESFSRVARALFSRGPTNWGQIVTLFYFGYRLVIRRVRSDVASAFRQVYNCLITFCRQLNIFRWIAEQGGWLILKYLRLTKTADNAVNSGESLTSTTAPDIHDYRDRVQSQPNMISTVLAVSSGIAIACVALFVYRRLYITH